MDCLLCLQVKYKQAGRQQAEASLFSKLPETLETKHAREASQLQSQVPERTAPQHPCQILIAQLGSGSTRCPAVTLLLC